MITHELGARSSWHSFFTGSPRLEVRDNVLRLELNIGFGDLELKFLKPIKDCRELISPDRDTLKTIMANCSRDRHWIIVRPLRDQSLRGKPLVFKLASANQPQVPTRRYITIIRIDKAPQGIAYVYHNLVEPNDSNVRLYYPLYIFNISSYFAELFRTTLMGLFSFRLAELPRSPSFPHGRPAPPTNTTIR
jgi:hypothetical protein